jgi:hypothetical protein
MILSLRATWILVLVTLLNGAHASTNSPSLTCANPVFEFGRHNNTGDVLHNFLLENKGQTSLVISQVRSGCGCTRAELDRSIIPPGESATLSTRLSLRGIVGSKRTSIYLHTNDPLNPIFQCQLTGMAVTELDLSPSSLHFDIPLDGTNQPVRLTIRNNTDTPLHPVSLDVNVAFFRVQLETNIPGNQYTLTATLLTTAVTASVSGTIILRTDHPQYSRIEIPISASLIRDLNANPAELVLREIPPDRPTENRYIILQASSNQTFKVLKVEAIPPTLPVLVHSEKPAWVRIKAGPLRPSQEMNGTVIRIHTDYPRQPIVDIPVKVVKP